jgi:hypothetical protein
MKKVLFILGQLILFALFIAISSPLAQLFIGIFFHFHHLSWFISHPSLTSTRFYDPTGLIFMTGLYLVVLAIEAACRKLRTAGLWTTVMYALALIIVAFFTQFGWATHELY